MVKNVTIMLIDENGSGGVDEVTTELRVIIGDSSAERTEPSLEQVVDNVLDNLEKLSGVRMTDAAAEDKRFLEDVAAHAKDFRELLRRCAVIL